METLELKVEGTVKKVLMTNLKDMPHNLLEDNAHNIQSRDISTKQGEADSQQLTHLCVLDRAQLPDSNCEDCSGPAKATTYC